jgi:hypothetical protein
MNTDTRKYSNTAEVAKAAKAMSAIAIAIAVP